MKTDILADYLQVWGFEKNTIVFTDGSTGFGLELSPIDVNFQTDDGRNAVNSSIIQFLNGLPSNIDLQFVCDIERGNGIEIEKFNALSEGSKNEAAKALCGQRAELFSGYDNAGLLPKHSTFLFVRRPLSQKLIDRKNKLSFKTNKFPDIAERNFNREIEELDRLQADIVQGLRHLATDARVLSSSEIAEAVYKQWNPDRLVGPPNYDPEDVRSSLTFSDVMIDPSSFRIGGVKHKVLSLKNLPEATFSCMGALLQQLPFGSRLFFTIKVPDQTKEIDYLKTQRRITYSLARGKREGAHDIESEAKLQDLETLIDQLVSSGEKVFHTSLNVLIKGKDDDELEDQINQVLTAIRQLSGAEAMVETVAGFSVFSEIAIPNARARERIKRLKTSNLADLLPLYGPWPGSKSPSLLFRSNQDTLLKFDVFDSQNSNYNQLISGGSGSGKSFLCNLILMQMLKENPQVFFVDIGGSYKKLSENLNGQYVPLSLDDTISLNPFDLAVGEQVVSSSKIKFLLGLVELMTKEDGDSRLPKLERAVIEKAIEELYREFKEPRLSNLRDVLLNDSDPEIQKLGKILSPWCGDTLFGKFLDRKTNIELNKPLVAFDLKGLESYPELQAVCLFLITDLVWREVQRTPSMKKFLIFDECWKLLKNESGIIFIEEVFRTFRKYNASAIAISQDVDDFAKSKISKALLSNCSIKWLLMQQQIDEASLRNALGLNDCEIEILRSLHQVKGHYSQVLLLAQKDRAVCKVEATPLEYWLATTDPRDLGELSKLANEKPELSKFNRLKMLAEKYPFGMSGQEGASA